MDLKKKFDVLRGELIVAHKEVARANERIQAVNQALQGICLEFDQMEVEPPSDMEVEEALSRMRLFAPPEKTLTEDELLAEELRSILAEAFGDENVRVTINNPNIGKN